MSDYVLNSPENRRQILRMVIKCADVSNPARDTPVMKVWANRIAEEYFQQVNVVYSGSSIIGLIVVGHIMPLFQCSLCSRFLDHKLVHSI